MDTKAGRRNFITTAAIKYEKNRIKWLDSEKRVRSLSLSLENSNTEHIMAVEGLGADQNGNISVAQNATIEQRDAARMAMLSVIGQSEGQLTIAADGEMPDVDIPVVVILLG